MDFTEKIVSFRTFSIGKRLFDRFREIFVERSCQTVKPGPLPPNRFVNKAMALFSYLSLLGMEPGLLGTTDSLGLSCPRNFVGRPLGS